MAATDATPIPIKNQAFRVYFPIRDNDGDLITGAASLDSERSLDGATFADCTNEATEVATSSGIYYLDLTAAEMNTSCTVVKVKSTTTDSKDTVLVFYPQEAGDIPVDVETWLGTAAATPTTAGVPEVDVTFWLGTAVTTSSTSTKPEVDVFSVSDDATAANNLELMYDTTGYTDDTAPASRAQVDAIGATSGGSVNIEATEDNTGGAIDPSSAAFVGSVQGATTFANTEAEDGTLHDIDDTANDIDIVYGFDVGGTRVATGVSFAGFCQGNSDEIKVKAYDHVGADWEVIGTLSGQAGTTNVTLDLPLLLKHTGSGAEAGKVYIRFETDSTTPSNLSVDKLLVSAVTSSLSIGYADGAIWFDDSASNTTSVENVDGVADNPVSTWAAVKSLITSVGVSRVRIAAGSTVTLDANSDNLVLIGSNWSLALGGQSIDGIYVEGASSVTGTGEATATAPTFRDCIFGAATVPPANFYTCGFGLASGTFSAAVDAGEYFFEDCYSAIPGSASPAFDFSPVNASSGINNRGWRGGATYTLDSNCTLSHEVLAGGGTTVTTGGGDVEVRGVCRALTVTMSAAETVQFAGVTGPITLSGTTTGTVNLYGVSASLSDSTSGATVTDLTVSGTDTAAILADSNELQGDWADGGRLDLILDSRMAEASISTTGGAVDTVTTLTNLPAITTDWLTADGLAADAVSEIQSGLATAAALATVDTVVDSILVDTAEIGAAGAGLTEAGGTGDQFTAIPWAAAWDAEVQSECNDALVALGLDHLVSASVTGTDVADNSIVAYMVSKSATADWDSFVNTTDSLEAITDSGGGGPTAAQIADAVWDEAQADHVAAGSFGIVASEVASILVDTGTTLPATLSTAQADLDTLTGSDGVTLATSQPNYAPATAAAVAALNDLSAADVNAQVVDVLFTDSTTQPSSVVTATASVADCIAWLTALSRNKGTQTATTKTLRNDADSGDIATSTVSDDGTTFTRGEWT